MLSSCGTAPRTQAHALPAFSDELEAVDFIFSSPSLRRDWFENRAVYEKSLEQRENILTRIGRYEGLENHTSRIITRHQKGYAEVSLTLGERKRISSFAAKPRSNGNALADAALLALPGELSITVRQRQRSLLNHHADKTLSVASAFKLAVLQAVIHAQKNGMLRADELLTLEERHRSLPSGILHRWPIGSKISIDTLVSLMISESDNTATDMLIERVGRHRVEAFSNEKPLLTTREFFILSATKNQKLRMRFQSAGEKERRRLLSELSSLPLPHLEELDGPSRGFAVEWHFSANELCDLMMATELHPATQIKPGPIDSGKWAQISFKAGNDHGVISMVHSLRHANGKRYCIAAIWNRDGGVDQTRFIRNYQQLVDNLLKHAIDKR